MLDRDQSLILPTNLSKPSTREHVRPILKWAGNKYRLLTKILAALPAGSRLIEPFVGSGAVFLNTDYDQYVLMDINQDIINLYQIIKTEGKEFSAYAKQLFVNKNNAEKIYYKYREEFNDCDEQARRAALFLYLNRHGYNGLCRYNSKGHFNVPFGSYKQVYFPEKEFLHFIKKSKRAKFVCGNFLTHPLHKKLKIGDICYCDPPYVPLSASANFTRYAQQDFGETEQQQLASLASKLQAKNIPVLISNHDTPFTRELYQQADLASFPVQRHISCDPNKRLPVAELLALF